MNCAGASVFVKHQLRCRVRDLPRRKHTLFFGGTFNRWRIEVLRASSYFSGVRNCPGVRPVDSARQRTELPGRKFLATSEIITYSRSARAVRREKAQTWHSNRLNWRIDYKVLFAFAGHLVRSVSGDPERRFF